MKTRYFSLLLFVALLMGSLSVSAQQRDSRNRLASTVIADGLTQLPAQTPDKYNQVIGEMAATGAEGMEMLVGMMGPSEQAKNAAYEYAINGIVNYVSAADKADLRQGVHDGLVAGLAKSTDKVNKSFLLSQLQKISTVADANLLKGYLSDSYLSDFAAQALAQTPGTEQVIVDMIKNASAPKDVLAYLASFKKLSASDVEPTLLSWVPGADNQTLRFVYDALAKCGTSASLKTLAAAAQKSGYNDDATSANNAYMQLLSKLATTEPKAVAKAAKGLVKLTNPAMRSAGLELLLKTAGNKAGNMVMKALKDGDKQYRNTALSLAEEVAGKNIFNTIASKFKSLPVASQIDVVRWLGNNHAAAFADVAAGAVSSNNAELAQSAIYALGQMGGDKALETLISNLGGTYGQQAFNALSAFNGNINSGVVKALASTDARTQVSALNLASLRRMSNAYPQVVKMLSTTGGPVKEAAYNALKGVARSENFDEICSLMEKADGQNVKSLQAAAKNAILTQTADEQYSLISKRLASTSKPALYYPLLAQAANSDAIAKLLDEYKNPATADEAYASLLNVNNPEMINTLYDIATKQPARKNEVLNRYEQLVKASPMNGIQKYLAYSKALEMKPSAAVAQKFVNDLADIHELPALQLAASYLDNADCKSVAANAVKTILSKNGGLLGGSEIKSQLEKARDVYRSQTDADSGYAVDEINGMLPKSADEGFKKVVDKAAIDKRLALPGKYENFELYLEWKTDGSAEMNLRSMPVMTLRPNGSSLHANKYANAPAAVASSDWNTLYVKVINDRIDVVENGVNVLKNGVLKNTLEGRSINAEGVISWWEQEGATEVRNVSVKALPSTPVYELSDEEKKAGFEVLFDGRSLEKWHGNTVNYIPDNGTIYVSAGYGSGGNLYTNKKYSDFVYRFEFCFLEPGVNNGIGIRTSEGVDAAYEGMEIQVLDHDDPIYKGLRDYQQHGSVYGIIVPKHVVFKGTNVWNTEEIRAVGDHITVTVNGEVILDGNIREACQGHNIAPDGGNHNPYTVDHLNHPGLFNKEGLISFCGHGEGVRFRNVRILDLSKQKTKKNKRR